MDSTTTRSDGDVALPDRDASIEVRDLVIAYTSGGYVVRPINGLDVDAHANELILLVGASGCGKTSLLSVLAGILRPADGTVRVGGVDVTRLKGKELARYRRDNVGVVFQAFNLIPSLTAIENVMVPLRAARVPHREARKRAGELLERVSMGPRLHHRPGDLSGGQQQRVAIARALVHDAPVLLADEPTAHLDYIQVEGVLRLLRELADGGRLVVIATHDERMLPLANRVVHLTPRADMGARAPQRVELAPGAVLFEQGDTGDLVYVVDAGAVEIVRPLANGGVELVSVITPPNYFGELAPMLGLQRSATARAAAGSGAVVTGYTLRDFRERYNLPSFVPHD